MAVKAVTFDFWRTLFRDTRSRERREVRVRALVQIAGIEEDHARTALKNVLDHFLRTHVYEQRTLHPRESIPLLERELGRTFETAMAAELVEIFATAILREPPDPIDGALEAVAATAERMPIALISDSGISPGSSLTVLLDRHGFTPYFKRLSFSDEVGVAKPQSAMYAHAAEGLGLNPTDTLHIGDLEPTDIRGAHAVGARAALFAGDNDKYLGRTAAQHTITDWREYAQDVDAFLA